MTTEKRYWQLPPSKWSVARGVHLREQEEEEKKEAEKKKEEEEEVSPTLFSPRSIMARLLTWVTRRRKGKKAKGEGERNAEGQVVGKGEVQAEAEVGRRGEMMEEAKAKASSKGQIEG